VAAYIVCGCSVGETGQMCLFMIALLCFSSSLAKSRYKHKTINAKIPLGAKVVNKTRVISPVAVSNPCEIIARSPVKLRILNFDIHAILYPFEAGFGEFG
jgi:hypothetical protein